MKQMNKQNKETHRHREQTGGCDMGMSEKVKRKKINGNVCHLPLGDGYVSVYTCQMHKATSPLAGFSSDRAASASLPHSPLVPHLHYGHARSFHTHASPHILLLISFFPSKLNSGNPTSRSTFLMTPQSVM